MINCRETRKVTSYLEGLGGKQWRQWFEYHKEDCPFCHQALIEKRKEFQMLADSIPYVTPSAEETANFGAGLRDILTSVEVRPLLDRLPKENRPSAWMRIRQGLGF